MSELKSPRVQSLADAMSSEGDEPIRTKIQFRWSAGVEQLVELRCPASNPHICLCRTIRSIWIAQIYDQHCPLHLTFYTMQYRHC
jgi:hypothetical protein